MNHSNTADVGIAICDMPFETDLRGEEEDVSSCGREDGITKEK